ncbi:MAG: thioredoxin family protein [Acidobacteriota bacterium]
MNPLFWRPRLWFCGLVALLIMGSQSTDAAPYRILLRDGVSFEAKEQPSESGGFLYFKTLDDRTHTLAAELVDWEATLSANPRSPRNPSSNEPGEPSSTSDWRSRILVGAAGYREAVQDSQRTGKPLILYFYVEWCPYCSEFDREVLPSQEMRAYLEQILFVRVNPESSEDERNLAKQFDVVRYPQILVLSPRKPDPKEVPAFVRKSGDWVALPPSEFVKACKNRS